MSRPQFGSGSRGADLRIVEIRDIVAPMRGTIRNAYIDFSKMTASVVAVVTSVERRGRRIIGYGFNSNGRYAASGILRDRVMPRIMAADPRDLLDEAGSNLDRRRSVAELGPARRALRRRSSGG